jgi:hypothetical protein
LDSNSNIRFNRLDQILGAVNRNLEIPNSKGCKGIRYLFDYVCNEIENNKSLDFAQRLSANGKWTYSDSFDSGAMFVAFRAWKHGTSSTKELIQDWLSQPWNYKSQRKKLFRELVFNLSGHFRDLRSDWQFYADDIFAFDRQGYEQAWSALRDLQMLAVGAGLKGLVLLFDEFEDVITNMTNIAHQQAAFWNLIQFSLHKKYTGSSFYAVTPEFVTKCYDLLQKKRRNIDGIAHFQSLPKFQMASLDAEDLEKLALRIMRTHGEAYGWEPDFVMNVSELNLLVRQAASIQIQDRSRQAIIKVVKALDELLDKTR